MGVAMNLITQKVRYPSESLELSNHIQNEILHEKFKGLVRSNYLRIEDKASNFSVLNRSGKLTTLDDLLNESPIAVSFTQCESEFSSLIKLGEKLNSDKIKLIIILSPNMSEANIPDNLNAFIDHRSSIFNQFGFPSKEKQFKDIETNLNAIFLINTDRTVLYSKINFANEPFSYSDLLDAQHKIVKQYN